jgi:glyoxylase-like metal-dependent hydrolase (beta-lactamase superfamily II)
MTRHSVFSVSLWLVIGLLTSAGLADAQVDLSGNWATRQHEDQPDRGPGVGLGDYAGIPLTAAGRQWAESWDASRLTNYEHQCRVHVVHYIYRGPLNVRIWEEKDPKTQDVIAIKHYISTYEQTRTIWMDGRPHPPAWAPHTWMGFSTGRWDGDRLIVETTHIKQGWHRRNGVPASDQTTLTEYFIRHGSYFTLVQVIKDPVFLSEPMIKTVHFEVNPRSVPARNWLWPCQAVVEVATRSETDVPHYLPGKNPYLESSRKEMRLTMPGGEGGAPSIYPEWNSNRKQAQALYAEKPAAPLEPIYDGKVHVMAVQGNVHLLVGGGVNSVLHIGDEGVMIVDSQPAALTDEVIAAIRTLSSKPIRHLVNTTADADHMGGNEALAKSGTTRTGGVVVGQIGALATANIIAHENLMNRISAPTGSKAALPFAAQPTETFFGAKKEMLFNGEGVQFLHQMDAHTDGDIMVFFRRSDVLATGDLFSTTSYPVIDTARGGTIGGMIDALNRIIDIAIPSNTQEGGTMIVPGHGRIADEMDVVEYRDMVTMVRDRIQDMIGRKMTLAQVQAARPTFDFDARYGGNPAWTPAMFVEAVYKGLSQ